MQYLFLGNFTAIRPEIILWRIHKLDEIVEGRKSSFATKLAAGMGTAEQFELLSRIIDSVEIWIIVSHESDRAAIANDLNTTPPRIKTSLFTLEEVGSVQERFGLPSHD
jgi:hypothetical protein